MDTGQWYLLIGFLLLGRGLTFTLLGRSPFTSAIIYFSAGLVAGPTFLNFFHFDPLKESYVLELLTEIALLISLFSAGVKMPVPFKLKRWRAPLLLAWLSMSITVGLVALFAWYFIGMSIGAGVLLGAILAPTDPVLATDVQSRHPGDRHTLRFNLTCEAGINDGSAFPFIMLGLGLLGLHDLGEFGLQWLLMDVLWPTIIGIVIGVIAGASLAKIGWRLRGSQPAYQVLDDLAGLGLVAIAYGVSVSLDAGGFLAVFFAGVALRQTELKLASQKIQHLVLAEAQTNKQALAECPPNISVEALVFGEHLERLSELTLVLLLGGMLSLQTWNIHTFAIAFFLFLIARPLSVLIVLGPTRMPWNVCALTAWFGVRGIGSVYYLMHAIHFGLPATLANELVEITLGVIALSILVHGGSVKPLISRFGHE